MPRTTGLVYLCPGSPGLRTAATTKTGSSLPLLRVNTMEKEKTGEEDSQKRVRDGAETRKKRRIDTAVEKTRMDDEEAATKREEEEEAARKREEE